MKSPFTYLIVCIFFAACSGTPKQQTIQNTNIFYDQAFEFLGKAKTDQAFLAFNRAKDHFLQLKDSLGAAKCLVNMAMISTDKGDYFGGEELSLNALDYFNKKDSVHFIYLRSNYNNLGLAAESLRDYDKSIGFYQQSIAFTTDSNDVLIIRNNIANVYREKKDFKKAIANYTAILTKISTGEQYARVLSNLAFTQWLADKNYNAFPQLEKALNIRLAKQDFLGLNASYAHLSDYYASTQPERALAFAEKMYKVAILNKRPDDRLKALQKLIKLSAISQSKNYFSQYETLDDSLQNARNAAKNQFALIRYETEKHKADFLDAQAENSKKQNEIIIRNFGLGILGIILITLYLWYRKRNELLRQEKVLEVKNTELRYVKKVHDRVANKVYHVMSEVENTSKLDRENLLDKLEVLYNISRNISYENDEVSGDEHFTQQLNILLNAYASETVIVAVNGNHESIWEKVPGEVKSELLYVLQELMTNMKKHSGAKNVIITFEPGEKYIQISYSDDGVGVKGPIKYNNGLSNTGNRMEAIRGKITFDTNTKTGLSISLAVPVS